MLKVESIMPVARGRLTTVGDDALLVDAARLLGDQRHNLLVVCDGSGAMAGVITRTDIVAHIGQCTGSSCRMPVARVMTGDVVFCRPDDRLYDVWATIRQRGLKNLPVVGPDNRPVGVLNARDVLQSLLEDVQYEEHLLRDYVMSVGYQ